MSFIPLPFSSTVAVSRSGACSFLRLLPLVLLLLSSICNVVSSVTTFTLSGHTLERDMFGNAVAMYNGRLYTINGKYDYQTEIFAENNALFPAAVDSNLSWTTHAVAIPSIPGNNYSMASSVPERLLMYSQQFYHPFASNRVYVVKPMLQSAVGFLVPLNFRFLLIYDLDAHQYLNMSSYSSLSTSTTASNANHSRFQRNPCVAYNPESGLLYSIGGHGYDDASASTIDLDRAHVYHRGADTWSWVPTNTPLAQRRSYAGCAMDALSRFVYVIGGWGPAQNSEEQNTVIEYDVSTDANNWSMRVLAPPAVIKTASYYLRCVLMHYDNAHIYCVGGRVYTGSVALADVNVLDTNALTVDSDSYALHTARWYHTLFAVDDCLYVSGGKILGADSSSVNTIEYLCLNETSAPTMQPSSITDPPTGYPTDMPTTDRTSEPTYVPTMQPTTAEMTTTEMTMSTTMLELELETTSDEPMLTNTNESTTVEYPSTSEPILNNSNSNTTGNVTPVPIPTLQPIISSAAAQQQFATSTFMQICNFCIVCIMLCQHF